eukprot:3404274-Pleurochrysis_carterae.AAC.1
MTGGSNGGETPTRAAGGSGDPDEAAEQGSKRGTATCSKDTKRRRMERQFRKKLTASRTVCAATFPATSSPGQQVGSVLGQ